MVHYSAKFFHRLRRLFGPGRSIKNLNTVPNRTGTAWVRAQVRDQKGNIFVICTSLLCFYSKTYECRNGRAKKTHRLFIDKRNIMVWTSVTDQDTNPALGSTRFWASWMRIQILLSSSKNSKKTLIPTVWWLLFYFLSLKNDVNVPSKSRKTFFIFTVVFCWRL